MMKRLSLFMVIASVSILAACNKDNNCSEGVCNLEFRTILLEVIDSDGTPVVFDEFSVTNLDTGEAIDLEWESGDRYPIADDSMFNELPRDGQRIEFVGIIGGQEAVRETFLVGHDCCHIQLLEGETTIQL